MGTMGNRQSSCIDGIAEHLFCNVHGPILMVAAQSET